MLSQSERPKTFTEVIGQDFAVTSLKAVARSPNKVARAVVLQGPWGAGKCVAPDSIIRTQDGLRKASTLIPGENTLCAGMKDSVPAIEHNEETNLIKITTKTGKVLRVTGNHPVYILKDNKFEWVKAENLKVGDVAIADLTINSSDYEFSPHWFFYGLIIGTAKSTQGVKIPLILNDKKLISWFRAYCRTSNITVAEHKLVDDRSRFLINDRKIRSDIDLYQLEWSREAEKVLPNVFYHETWSNQLSLVQGIMDSSARILKNGGAEISMQAEKVVRGVSEVCNALGLPTIIDKHSLAWKMWLYYAPPQSLYSRIFRESEMFLAFKPSRISHDRYTIPGSTILQKDPIVALEPDKASYTVDIECEINHMFVCDGIITHNTTLSRIFAKAVNCKNFKKLGDVCNECDSCKESSLENSSLVMEYDSSRISDVASIKSIIDRSMISAGDGMSKVIILDEVHALSKASFTALLKVLEEGQDDLYWVFPTTENLMPTIMSRSWVVQLSTVAPSVLEQYIKSLCTRLEVQIQDKDLRMLVAKSKGHVRDALQYLDQYILIGTDALITPYEDIKRLLYKVLKKEDLEEDLNNLSKFTVSSIKDAINLLLRNIFIKEGTFEAKLNELGMANKLFKFFFLPEVRLALNDEYGSILVFRSLVMYFK